MLREVVNIDRAPGQQIRRWFSDPQLDLIVWYTADGGIAGFQFCYDKSLAEHALTWRRGRGFRHDAVDDGESVPGQPKSTPVLLPDGDVPFGRILDKFQRNAAELDPAIAHFVEHVLREISTPSASRPE